MAKGRQTTQKKQQKTPLGVPNQKVSKVQVSLLWDPQSLGNQ